MKCILCCKEVNDIRVQEEIEVTKLAELYNKSFNLKINEFYKNIKSIKYICCPSCNLRYFTPVIAANENFYEILSANDWYYPQEKFEFDYIASFLNSKCTNILEVGAGNGSFARKLNANIKYTGIDFNNKAIESAQLNKIKVINKTLVELLEEHKENFDAVISFQVLEHVQSPYEFIKESLQLVKPGGYFVFATPSYDSFYKEITNHVLDLPPHHLTKWSDQCLKAIAEIFNLNLVELKHDPLHQMHYHFRISEAIKSKLLFSKKLVRDDFRYKLISKLSSMLGKLLLPFIGPFLKRMQGSHIIAIYKK